MNQGRIRQQKERDGLCLSLCIAQDTVGLQLTLPLLLIDYWKLLPFILKTIFRRPLSGRSVERPRSAKTESERPYSGRLSDRPRSSERPHSTERPRSGRVDRPGSGRRRRDSIESTASSGRAKKIMAFKENRSAKTIQKHWRTHQQDKVGIAISNSVCLLYMHSGTSELHISLVYDENLKIIFMIFF